MSGPQRSEARTVPHPTYHADKHNSAYTPRFPFAKVHLLHVERISVGMLADSHAATYPNLKPRQFGHFAGSITFRLPESKRERGIEGIT